MDFFFNFDQLIVTYDEQSRLGLTGPGPIMTLFEGLFLSQSKSHKIENLTQIDFRIYNFRLKFRIKIFSCFLKFRWLMIQVQ